MRVQNNCMKLVVDDDVAKVAEFMAQNVPGRKLQKVARALVQLGQLIWPEELPTLPFRAFGVAQAPIRPDLSERQPEATLESRPAPSTPQNGSDSFAHQVERPS